MRMVFLNQLCLLTQSAFFKKKLYNHEEKYWESFQLLFLQIKFAVSLSYLLHSVDIVPECLLKHSHFKKSFVCST